MKKCTIYLLSNIVNNKIYIGQTWLSLKDRMGREGRNYRNSIYLYSAIQKYGIDNFKYTVLAESDTQEEADGLEDQFIIQYNSRNPDIGYNIKTGGSAGKHSEETKAKIAQSVKNKIWSPEALLARSSTGKQWKGKKRGPQSKELKEMHANSMKQWHANNVHPMQGKHHTPESKLKISNKNKGRKDSQETIEKRAKSQLMDPNREQQILQAYLNGEAISIIEETLQVKRSSIYRILARNNVESKRSHSQWLGRKHSEETKAKMALARTSYWQNKLK